MTDVRMGEIGEPQHEIEFEPLTEPAPVEQPVTVPAEPVPAGVRRA